MVLYIEQEEGRESFETQSSSHEFGFCLTFFLDLEKTMKEK
jgi:hypothetical protein